MGDISSSGIPTAGGRRATSADRELSQQTLEALLTRLDPDRDEAARRYELLRSKLIRLFEWRGSAIAEELADETLDRVASKLWAGVEIEAADPYRYVCGVAYRVFQEQVRKNAQLRELQREYQRHAARKQLMALDADQDAEDRRMSCMIRCLEELPTGDRQLILRYHEGEKSARIRNRSTLAQELRLPINALRIRVHRIRRRVEQCTRECVSHS